MISHIAGTLKAIQSSIGMINEHAEAKAFNLFKAELTSLYKSLGEVQVQAIELHEELQTMKAKYIECEKWKTETLPNYKLAELAPGVLVYKFNPVKESTEPDHSLCADCFLNQKKSILQRTRRDGFGIHYHCHRCGADIIDHSAAESSNPPGVVRVKSPRDKWNGF